MATNEELLEVLKALKAHQKIVSCPSIPAQIPGSDSAVTIETGDTIGRCFSINVPTSGVVISARLLDFDDEGVQVDVYVFKEKIADIATDSPYAPTVAEGFTFLTELNFIPWTDQGVFRTSEIKNIGVGYSVPSGLLWFQAVTRGGITIAAGVPHCIQIDIDSDDPDWKE